MALRRITIEDDEYGELQDEIESLEEKVVHLEDRIAELEEIEEKWDSKDALLTRIGEL